MDTKIKAGLEERTNELLEKLKGMQPGSDAYKQTVQDLKVLHAMILDDEKTKNDSDEHSDEILLKRQEIALKQEELALKGESLKETASDHRWTKILSAVSTGSGLVTLCYWARRGFKFEESGTFTSNTLKPIFRDLIKIPKIF